MKWALYCVALAHASLRGSVVDLPACGVLTLGDRCWPPSGALRVGGLAISSEQRPTSCGIALPFGPQGVYRGIGFVWFSSGFLSLLVNLPRGRCAAMGARKSLMLYLAPSASAAESPPSEIVFIRTGARASMYDWAVIGRCSGSPAGSGGGLWQVGKPGQAQESLVRAVAS